MWRHIASNALTFFTVGLFLLGGVVLWADRSFRAQGPLKQAICVQVPRGATMRRMAEDLVEKGAITSAAVFNIGADYAGLSDDLKAGNFLVSEGASMEQIVDVLTRGGQSTCGTEVVYRVGVARTAVQVRELDPVSGRFVERLDFVLGEDEVPVDYIEVREEPDTRYRVALAEGVTSWQVVSALNSIDALTEYTDLRPDEGMLAPDSYEFVPGDTLTSIVDEMQRRQALILEEEWLNRADDLPVTTPEEALILASIIEKETAVADERGLVSSVFVNRLRRGMRLQTDPTVIYGVTGGEGVLGRGLRQSELRRETPYNTYVIDGLPPTPIANPGRAAIRAALNPDDSDFIFFVADGTGGHVFAETLAEHNRNVALWREIEAQQRRDAADGNE